MNISLAVELINLQETIIMSDNLWDSKRSVGNFKLPQTVHKVTGQT